MTPDPLDCIRSIRDIPALIAFLRDELDWPIGADDFDELTFDYEPEELGIDARTAARIEEIKQLRPLAAGQPWGVFFIRFEPKRLPIVVLRRILSQLVVKKRASAEKSHRAAWNLHDLLFISNYGVDDQRQITFAHFTQDAASGDLPTLKVLGWDDADMALHISHVHHELKEKLRWPEDEKDLDGWRERWSSAFTLRHRQVIMTSKDLAVRLADLARRIRRRAGQVLAVETERGPLRKLHKAFREALIHDLSEDDFADMYAQTIAYGLLAARVSRPMGIIAENVTDMVPVTNPFLREMLGTFLTIGGRKGKLDFDELGIQDVVDLLNNRDTHMEAILRDFGNRTRQEDPVIHFYELFLAEYDKKMKVKRGVFYTPQPVVSYIVRSVHELLQTEFGLPDGLADTTTWGEMAAHFEKIPSSSAGELSSSSLPLRESSASPSPPAGTSFNTSSHSRETSLKSSLPLREGSREGKSAPFKIPDSVSPDTPFVQILDPATGTATFLVEVIDVIHKTMTAKWKREKRLDLEFDRLWNEYVPKHLLPRLYGYELMMAPYAIAHMKIGLKLYETGYRFGSEERAHVYLTNALEPPSILAEQAAADLFEALGHEAQAVNAIKRDKRFTVVIGNPPYAGHSLNNSGWISKLVDDYYTVNGEPLGEQTSKWLQDDYVKFYRLAQHATDTSRVGIVGYITNHGYIRNPTFRGMRFSLSEAFPLIRVLDLHGSLTKKEKSPDGTADDNVFEIQAGVAIGLFSRSGNGDRLILHSDVFGSRDSKYHWLLGHSVRTTTWSKQRPAPPYFVFYPQNSTLLAEYGLYPKITDILPLNGVGMTTARDHVVIDFDRNPLLQRAQAFRDSKGSNKELCHELSIPLKQGWDITASRRLIQKEEDLCRFIQPVVYRPFDRRLIFYHDSLVWRTVKNVMRHMITGENLALLAKRQSKREPFSYIFCAKGLMESCVFESAYANVSIFPLYILEDGDSPASMFDGVKGRRPNFMPEFLRQLAARLSLRLSGAHGLPAGLTPEDIFHYAYGVFHSPGYRSRYVEFLKIDFPRLPLTGNLELFRVLTRLGGELVGLHLMESPTLNNFITTYGGPKNPEVGRVG